MRIDAGGDGNFVYVALVHIITPCAHARARGYVIGRGVYTGFFRSVVTKKRRESAHARILEGFLNGELRACVDSRRFFVTTDLKNSVYSGTGFQSR